MSTTSDPQSISKVSSRSVFETEHLKKDIKRRSVRGGATTIFGQGVIFAIHTISTIVLARLLAPSDFGLISMVTVVTGFAALFKDLGLSVATIQREQITHDQISTLFWINVALSAMIAALISGLSPFIAKFYGEPRITLITVALSMVFLLGGLTVQHQALLKRQMRFTALAALDVVSMSGGVCIACVCAALGVGYWSLVIMHAAFGLITAVGVWILCGWWPGKPVRGSGIKNMLLFGGNITAFGVVNYFSRNADNLLIGRFWGASALGFYTKAYSLLSLPLNQINIPLGAVAVPALSRLHSDLAKYKAYYLKTIFLITFCSTPIVCFFIACSDELILIILGPQWAPASDIFFVLGVSALFQPLYFTQSWLHVSAGKSDRYLRWGMIYSSLIVVAFFLGLPYGSIGVAKAYTIASTLLTFPGMWYAGGSAGIALRDILETVYKNFIAGFGSIAITFILLDRILLLEEPWANLLIGLCSIITVYNLLLLVLHRNFNPWLQMIDVARILIKSTIQNT